jgi:hypothetical protein
MAERAEVILSGKDQSAAAFASFQRNLTAARKQADASIASFAKLTAGIGALGLVTASVGAALNPRPIIDYADQLNKLSQRTGIAVEDLSALDYQAKLNDVSTEELSGALKRLNLNIAAAARGEKEQADAFKALGISVVDTTGKVRAADQVLGDLADRFAGYEDGPNKAALANAVGGKSFEKLIPLLNGGRDGLREAREELEKFGGVISGKLAQDAERFNDNMTKLGVASDALKVSIAGGLLDRLVEMSDKMVKAAASGNLLEFAVQRLKDVISGRATLEFISDSQSEKIAKAQAKVDDLEKSVAFLKRRLAESPEEKGLAKQLEIVEGNANAAKAALSKLRGEGANVLPLDALRAGEKDRTRVRGAAPKLSNSQAEAEAQALLRKQLDGRIKAIQDGLAREADLFEFQNSRLQDSLNDGVISIDEFYRRRSDLQAQFLVTQNKAFEAEIAEREQFQKRLSKAAEREEQGNQIAEVLGKQSKAQIEAGQAAEVAGIQQVRATREFQRSLAELDAQIAELQGNRFGAEMLRNAERLADAQRLLTRGGGDDQGRVQALQSALRAQAEFARLQDDVGRASERAAIAEERFLITAERAGLSRSERETELLRIREGSIAQLDKLIAQAEELAAKSTDPSVPLYLEQLRLARERAFDAKDPGLIRFNELAAEGGRTVAESFADAALEAGNLRDVLDDLDKRLARLLFDDLVTKPLQEQITNTIRNLGAQGQGGGAERLFSGVANAVGGLFGGTQAGATPAGAAATAVGAGGQAAQAAAVTASTAAITAQTTAIAASTAAETAATTALSARAAAEAAASAALAQFTASVLAAAAAAQGKSGGDVFSGIGGEVLASVFHGGGVVGASGGRSRAVSPVAWAGAERYHDGGVVGEVPAILQRGEEVLTASDPRHRDNLTTGGRRGDTYIVQVKQMPGASRASALQQGRDIADGITTARRRNG